jgi:predicted acetyltransferase
VRQLDVMPAVEADRPALEQLWTMFRHDMSAFTRALPDANGRFRQERLDTALSDPAWACYLLRSEAIPVGFAIVRGLDRSERVINSFFLVQGARRAGNGRAAVRSITRSQPGSWAVAYQDANVVAGRFWRSVAADADPRWSVTQEDVPGRPDLPGDSWVRFRVG